MQADIVRKLPGRPSNMPSMALSLLETMPGGAMLYEPSGTIVGINATGRRMLGLKARDVLGGKIATYFPDTQLEAIVRTGLPSSPTKVMRGDVAYVRMEMPVFAEGRVVAVLAHLMSRDAGLLREILPKLPLGNAAANALELAPAASAPAPEVVDLPFEAMTLDRIPGISRAIREARALAARAARTDMPVLIHGEAGTETSAFAQAIHQASDRRAGPFVVCDCRLRPETALMAELFGADSAPSGPPGRVEQARSGTLFLNDLAELSLGAQARLLQAIQQPKAAEIRIIAATGRDLPVAMAAGEFREDLYYRLNVIRLEVPPLRTRPEDIRVLAEEFLQVLNQQYARQGLFRRMSSAALEILLRYSWPGNTVELEGVISRACCVCDGEEILPQHLPKALQQIGEVSAEAVGQKTLDEIVAEVERGVILHALKATGHNRSRTAKLLGLPRSSFYEKLARYGLMNRKTG